MITADNYFTFAAYFLLAFGTTLELSLVGTSLALIEFVSSRHWQRIAQRPTTVLPHLLFRDARSPSFYSPVIVGVAFTFLYFSAKHSYD